MHGLIGALIGASGFGTANVVIKKSLSSLSIPQTLMMSTLSGVFFLTIFTLLSSAFEQATPYTLVFAIAFAFAEVVLYLSLYKAFSQSNVTVATAIISSYPLLSIVVSVLLLSETITLAQVIAIVALVLGVIVTSIDWSGVFRDGLDKGDLVKGLGWMVVTTVIHAVYFPLLGEFTNEGSWQMKLLLIKIFSSAIIFVFFYVYKKRKILPPRKLVPFTSLLGLLEVVGWAGFSWATSNTVGQTAILVATLNSAALFTAVFAYIFLKEKLSKLQYVGIVLIVLSLTGLLR